MLTRRAVLLAVLTCFLVVSPVLANTIYLPVVIHAPVQATLTTTPNMVPSPTTTGTPVRLATPTPSMVPTSAPTSTPEPTATSNIAAALIITHTAGYASPYNSYIMYGEIINTGDVAAFDPQLVITFYDASNHVLAINDSASVFHELDPHGGRAPFGTSVSNPAYPIARYTITLTASTTSFYQYRRIAISKAARDVGGDGIEVSGNATNNQDVPLQYVHVAATTYDSQGNIFEMWSGEAFVGDKLAPGGTVPYQLNFLRAGAPNNAAAYVVEAEAQVTTP